MKYLLSAVFALCVFSACNLMGNSDAKEDKNYEKTKETLEETEKKNPIKFIQVEGEKKKNLIGQTVVLAEIKNNAKIVSYKDVDVKISFYSKTGVVLEEDHEIVFETITPGNSVKFKFKAFTPKGSDSVGFRVVEARF
jgi:hypothetical protein